MRFDLQALRGRRALIVASTGGHLSEMMRILPQLELSPDSLWVTSDVPQSHSALAGQNVFFVPYVAPRDLRGVLHAARMTAHLQREYEAAVSTGAGLALSVLPSMAMAGKPSVFVESISRVAGPSTTGRMLQYVPRVGLYTAHAWRHGPWREGPSALSAYHVESVADPLVEPRRIFVTLGTIRPYRFDRLIDQVRDYARSHPEAEFRWQLGSTLRDDLPGEVHAEIGASDFEQIVGWADVVVSHAGVGIAMNILDAGKMPVLMPRLKERDEHVDSHQHEILDHLVEQGLAVTAEEAFTDPAVLARAASTRIGMTTGV